MNDFNGQLIICRKITTLHDTEKYSTLLKSYSKTKKLFFSDNMNRLSCKRELLMPILRKVQTKIICWLKG